MFHFMKLCNVLKPKRNYTYHQVEHSEILYSAHNVITCCLWISEQTAMISLQY
jgi:hypothetical protein